MSFALEQLRLVDEMESELGVRLCAASARKFLDDVFAELFADWAENEAKEKR